MFLISSASFVIYEGCLTITLSSSVTFEQYGQYQIVWRLAVKKLRRVHFSCHAQLVTKNGFVNISQTLAQLDLVSKISQQGVDVVKPWNVGVDPLDILLKNTLLHFDNSN